MEVSHALLTKTTLLGLNQLLGLPPVQEVSLWLFGIVFSHLFHSCTYI